jgi:hydroxymethylglutaryl-CoA synthase
MSDDTGEAGADERDAVREDVPLAVTAVGAYAPPARVEADTIADAWGSFDARGIDRTAVAAGDEDALTMGIEAAERALDAGDYEGSDLGFLAVATTTPPVAESDLTARLGSALGVGDRATRHVFTGSTRAGTRALVAALDTVQAAGPGDVSRSGDGGLDGPALVVASDCPRGEPSDARDHAAGAGAAAFLVERDHEGVRVYDRSEYADAFPGTRFRRSGNERVAGVDVTSYDRQAFRETVAGAVDGLDAAAAEPGPAPGAVDAAAIQSPDGDLPYRAARDLPVDTGQVAAGTVVSDLGDLGAASSLVGVASALADGAESLLLVGYGSGGAADAVLLSGSCPVDAPLEGTGTVDYPAYLRRRGEITPGEPTGGGAYVSVPVWRQSLPQRHRLVAGRCPECGALAYPPEGACTACHALVDFERVELPRTGSVETATGISRGGAPPEFAVQQARGGDLSVTVVEFAVDGDTVSVPLQGVLDADSLAPGDRVEAVIRRLYTQEGVTRYARKVRPVDVAAD